MQTDITPQEYISDLLLVLNHFFADLKPADMTTIHDPESRIGVLLEPTAPSDEHQELVKFMVHVTYRKHPDESYENLHRLTSFIYTFCKYTYAGTFTPFEAQLAEEEIDEGELVIYSYVWPIQLELADEFKDSPDLWTLLYIITSVREVE